MNNIPIKNSLKFKPVKTTHAALPKIISLSIGMATSQKMTAILSQYNTTNFYLIGAFINEELIGIIGIETCRNNGIIHHIAVLTEHRMKNIARQMIIYAISFFSLKCLSAETDDDAVEFYRKCGFQCKPYDNHCGKRYHCTMK